MKLVLETFLKQKKIKLNENRRKIWYECFCLLFSYEFTEVRELNKHLHDPTSIH